MKVNHQGGCGACTVLVAEAPGRLRAVPACLTPVLACHGWALQTVEAEQDSTQLQRALAAQHGSQCGFCSPGIVMVGRRLLQDRTLSPHQLERGMAGNICRCTGYRPVLDAVKSAAQEPPDIEEMGTWVCPARAAQGETAVSPF